MLKQFDVYRNPDPETRNRWPYYIIIQNDYYAEFSSRVIMPLARKMKVPGWLESAVPKVNVEFETLILYSPLLAHLEVKKFRPQDYVGNLRRERSCVVGAIDALVANI
ncbi:toxin CcdB [Kosakonia sacchari]|nr:toxin CcdB [Kosakonia sacchari]